MAKHMYNSHKKNTLRIELSTQPVYHSVIPAAISMYASIAWRITLSNKYSYIMHFPIEIQRKFLGTSTICQSSEHVITCVITFTFVSAWFGSCPCGRRGSVYSVSQKWGHPAAWWWRTPGPRRWCWRSRDWWRTDGGPTPWTSPLLGEGASPLCT